MCAFCESGALVRCRETKRNKDAYCLHVGRVAVTSWWWENNLGVNVETKETVHAFSEVVELELHDDFKTSQTKKIYQMWWLP